MQIIYILTKSICQKYNQAIFQLSLVCGILLIKFILFFFFPYTLQKVKIYLKVRGKKLSNFLSCLNILSYYDFYI